MRGGGRGYQRSQLPVDELDRAPEPVLVPGLIQPAADPGRVRQRDRDRSFVLEALADALIEAREAEQAAGGEPTDGNDQPRPQKAQLPLAPERAELLLVRARRPVAAPSGRAARVAARDGGAVEGRVELVLLELEPTAQRLPRAAAPGPPLFALDNPGRLPEHVGPLTLGALEHGQRLERIPGLSTGAADPIVALK